MGTIAESGAVNISWNGMERRLDQLAIDYREFRLDIPFGSHAAACGYDLTIVSSPSTKGWYRIKGGAGAVLDIVKNLFTPDNRWHPPVSNLIDLADRETGARIVLLQLSLRDGRIVGVVLVIDELS